MFRKSVSALVASAAFPLSASLLALGALGLGVALAGPPPAAAQASPSQASASKASPSKASIAQAPALEASERALLLSLLENPRPAKVDLEAVERSFDRAWWAPVLETHNFVRDPQARARLMEMLARDTGVDHGADINRWFRWLWNESYVDVPGYDAFKTEYYREIDPRFGRYFEGRADQARIRLDEVRWGGVRQDGIPPLRNPKMLRAEQADYLDDDNVVFGIEVGGDARAYPKRILAWHEMFTDTVGGVEVAGVYCTLCGTVILYDVDGHDLGTSGFLYRSNKLMYDRATQSLWNTLTGEPVIGPLAEQGIALDHRSVVTTTWGKWRELHPDTQVLSLDTGHRRDYAEGVAYHDYFADDDLMFNTPFVDSRLANKQEVLALRFKGQSGKSLAIDTDFLRANPVYAGAVGSQRFVVLTDETGANRVYDPGDIRFTRLDDRTVTDTQGRPWQITESRLTAPDGRTLERLPYHRAFWFGWQAAYPDTELVR